MKDIQLRLSVADKDQMRRSWAFAIDPAKSRRRALRNINHCIITAVSKEAKSFGVRTGMVAAEARMLMPGLKVLVCNWR